MAGWLQIVKDKEGEVGEFEMELKKLEKSRLPRPSAKEKLKERVIRCITTVKALIVSKDAISLAMETFISEVATGKPTQFSEWQLKEYTSDFATSTVVGSGEFGVVYKGVLRNNVEIAVKVLHDSGMDNMEKQFKAEVNTMSRTSHRNLAKLYGYCFDAKKKALVYEFVKNGSLDKILYDGNSSIEWGKLYNIAVETAKGLSYLHENCDERIIHRDIKAGNVLLDSNFCPKLTDFGLAKFYGTDKSQVALSSGFRGVRNYDAPELRFGNKRKVSYKCDVFSFGVMLFEILTRKKCEGDNSLALHVWDKFQKGVLDEFITDKCGIVGEEDKDNAKTLSIVALLCIEHKPQDRPSMSKVVNILTGVIKPSTPLNPFLNYNSSSERILILDSTGGSGSLETPQIIFPTINER
ncbi:hypothetical protein AQUCO_02800077v1 [Aquilegia coerulea]|uniref:non-specific serine/threonine protein kinase n=1 Tax=Aquilegia coerulea TaxID=218851 RepID=A0A2G5D3W1_AQUCA|nr:hypothetical protein AQUCO_02800077v1 [Aquilegia coerulea]